MMALAAAVLAAAVAGPYAVWVWALAMVGALLALTALVPGGGAQHRTRTGAPPPQHDEGETQVRPDLNDIARRIDAAVAAGQDPFTALVDAEREALRCPACRIIDAYCSDGQVLVCGNCGHSWAVGDALCASCGKGVYWIAVPTGGWWAHFVVPADGHDADPERKP